MNPTDTLLDRLLAALPPEASLERCWPDRPFHARLAVADFLQLPGFATLATLDDVLAHYRGPVMAVGEVCLEESEGLKDRFLVPVEQVRHYYQAGAALEFDFAHLHVPACKRTVEDFRRRLGLASGTIAKAIVYASAGGAGFPAHFDAYANFIFQIQGEKVWSLRHNDNVQAPVEHYDHYEYPYVPDELSCYWQGEAPDGLLSDGWTEVLQPGSLMFLPRGVWHRTEASGETLSINLNFSAPTWLDAILAELRRRLVADERWRGMLDSGGEPQLAQMLQSAAAEVGSIREDQLLSWRETPLDYYQVWNQVFRQSMLR